MKPADPALTFVSEGAVERDLVMPTVRRLLKSGERAVLIDVRPGRFPVVCVWRETAGRKP